MAHPPYVPITVQYPVLVFNRRMYGHRHELPEADHNHLPDPYRGIKIPLGKRHNQRLIMPSYLFKKISCCQLPGDRQGHLLSIDIPLLSSPQSLGDGIRHALQWSHMCRADRADLPLSRGRQWRCDPCPKPASWSAA